jgi:hypothetical protein
MSIALTVAPLAGMAGVVDFGAARDAPLASTELCHVGRFV